MTLAIASRSRAMQFLQMAVGIAVCLCWLSTPQLVDAGAEYRLSQQEKDEIVRAHNTHRAAVDPPASNMQRLFWSESLAQLAALHAYECNFEHGEPRLVGHGNHRGEIIGENTGISFSHNITELAWYWFSEGRNYNFYTQTCTPDETTYTCNNYLQLVWATTCEVGCAIAFCPNLAHHDDYRFYYNYYFGGPDRYGYRPVKPFLVVCNYAPAPTDFEHRPYRQGKPCTKCPKTYPLCILPSAYHGDREDSTDRVPGLCYNRQEACIGSDPHFAIRLSGGALLCYNFQGRHNTTFNLVSNDQLQMNALFVPDETDYDNTWLGSIGIAILQDGKKATTLQFTAADQLVKIGERVVLDAKTIKKLTFHNGKLTMLRVPADITPRYPRVQVDFLDSELNFTVGFAKNNHLELYWHSTGAPYKHSKGIIGQFFRDGVDIDVDAQLLYMPGRPPVPVEEKDLWQFTKQSMHSDTKCWTSAYHSSQGAGIIAGTFRDYIVEDILSVEC